ncbi:MAG TPA: hypothetical protein DDZ51_10960, partial [Planctomycetaceae bacterium]|nr:hypothetical protein [Planctomycetaceae bacterium]
DGLHPFLHAGTRNACEPRKAWRRRTCKDACMQRGGNGPPLPAEPVAHSAVTLHLVESGVEIVSSDNYISLTHCLNETDTERYWLPQLKDTQIVSAVVKMLAKTQLIDSIRSRYYAARKRDKSRILDEFVAITEHQRKYALRMLAERQVSTLATSG